MNEEFSFMNEKIKDKPFYKKKWVKILASTVVLAVIFGLIASAVFSKVSDWIENKKEQEAMTDIEIPQDTAEDSAAPEVTDSETEPSISETIVVDPQITMEDYMVLANYIEGFEDGIVDAYNSPLVDKYFSWIVDIVDYG